MEFRVKDLLITTLPTVANAVGDPICVTPTGLLCCCVGWTANGTTKSSFAGLTPSHLEALRTEIRAEPATPADDTDLDALEAKLTEVLETVRSHRSATKP